MTAAESTPSRHLEFLPGNLHWRLAGTRYSQNNLAATILVKNHGDVDVRSLKVVIRPQSHCSILGPTEWYAPLIPPGVHLALGEMRLSTLEDQCVLGAECFYHSGDPRHEAHTLTIPGSHAVAQRESLLFVSYRSTDFGRLQGLLQRLQSLPVRVWIAHCNLDTKAGDWFPSEVAHALDRAEIFVPILSRHALQSPWVLEEIRIARNLLVTGSLRALLPIAIDDVKVPPELQLRPTLRYDPASEDGWSAVESSVREVAWGSAAK